MNTNYELTQIGLGDITFFCGEIMYTAPKGSFIRISLNNDILSKFRNNSKNYKKFCFDYIKFILSDYVIIELDLHNENYIKWVFKPDIAKRMLTDKNIKNQITKKFLSDKKINDITNYIVLFTKVRDFHKENFNSIKETFFKKINSLNKKILLLGERSISYSGEYLNHDKNMTYSLYDEYIKNINSEKIIDLTKDFYLADDINLKNILTDLNLISYSDKIILFGGGGFFCTSLFTNNLLSLNSSKNCEIFNHVLDKNVFLDSNNFLNNIPNE